MNILKQLFGECQVSILEIRGVVYFIAREIGAALEYASNGRALVVSINEWRAQGKLRDEHVWHLAGADLAAARGLRSDLGPDDPAMADAGAARSGTRPAGFAITEPVIANPKTRSVVLLTERGLYRVLMLAGGSKAVAFQDWPDGEVLPSLRATGRYELPGGQPALSDPTEEPDDVLHPMDEAQLLIVRCREMRLLARQLGQQGDHRRGITLLRQAADALLGGAPPELPSPPVPADVCGPLFAAWLAEGGATMTATEVLAFADARGLLCEETRGDTPHARVTRLGVLLRERTASPVAGYRLSARRHHGNVAHYSLRAS